MAKRRKRLSQREKDENARIKKELQAEGVYPPDKPRLNRRKFAEDVMKEWNDFMLMDLWVRGLCLDMAVNHMVSSKMNKVTPEQVGVLKLLKMAIEMKKFSDELKAEGRVEYTIGEYMERVVLPIIKL